MDGLDGMGWDGMGWDLMDEWMGWDMMDGNQIKPHPYNSHQHFHSQSSPSQPLPSSLWYIDGWMMHPIITNIFRIAWTEEIWRDLCVCMWHNISHHADTTLHFFMIVCLLMTTIKTVAHLRFINKCILLILLLYFMVTIFKWRSFTLWTIWRDFIKQIKKKEKKSKWFKRVVKICSDTV